MKMMDTSSYLLTYLAALSTVIQMATWASKYYVCAWTGRHNNSSGRFTPTLTISALGSDCDKSELCKIIITWTFVIAEVETYLLACIPLHKLTCPSSSSVLDLQTRVSFHFAPLDFSNGWLAGLKSMAYFDTAAGEFTVIHSLTMERALDGLLY